MQEHILYSNTELIPFCHRIVSLSVSVNANASDLTGVRNEKRVPGGGFC